MKTTTNTTTATEAAETPLPPYATFLYFVDGGATIGGFTDTPGEAFEWALDALAADETLSCAKIVRCPDERAPDELETLAYVVTPHGADAAMPRRRARRPRRPRTDTE